MINPKKLIQFVKSLLIFITGMLFGNLVWHLRLKKPILLRELLLDLQSGGTPFLDWFIGLGYIILFIWGLYFICFKWDTKKKKSLLPNER